MVNKWATKINDFSLINNNNNNNIWDSMAKIIQIII